MSKLFCVSPGLRVLERQMQQPPGYRPRGYGICVMDVDWRSRGNYSEIVDCVISRMQMEHLKKRVDEIFCEVDKELIFRNPKHRNDFYAMLFNILSYMSNELLTNGYTAASIDEFYLFLTNLTAVEYIRNFMKRVRKKESAVILASQNLEDFNIDGIREYTKPLFSIPTHAFLFNAGNIDARFYIDTLQLEKSEYNLIRYPQRGVCLYKCGNERYNLMVHAPEYKEKLFGNAGGR